MQIVNLYVCQLWFIKFFNISTIDKFLIVCNQDLISDLENQKAELDIVELSAPLEAEQTDYVEQMATVSHQYDLSSGKIKRVKQKMAKRLDKFIVFMDLYEEIQIWLVEMQKVVDNFEPVSSEYDTAKTQLEELRVSFFQFSM